MAAPDAFAHGTPCWVDLRTSDIARSHAFYTALFGWEWTEAPGERAYWHAPLEGKRVAGLYEDAGDSAWTTHISVRSLNDALANAVSAGATIDTPGVDLGDGGRGATVLDPCGARLGLWQTDAASGAGLTSAPGAMVWNEVFAPDTEAEIAFYSAILGWRAEPVDNGDGPPYINFLLGDRKVAGTFAPPGDGSPPRWQVWFGSADVDATAARAAELAGTVVMGPMDSPAGRIAFLSDATGAAFAIHPA